MQQPPSMPRIPHTKGNRLPCPPAADLPAILVEYRSSKFPSPLNGLPAGQAANEKKAFLPSKHDPAARGHHPINPI